ncbi:MAG TPA: amidase [Gammaproteobacteria bacterium]|nr:amidase [Gammaproteobacteria bacterium]
MTKTVAGIAAEVREGRRSAEAVLAECLTRIDDPAGEGAAVFREVSRTTARATATVVDQLHAAGVPLPPLAGVPISVKDLFDVSGERTLAGSLALREREPATRDAPAIARLRQAGALLVGRTNMTEFAYSGLGLNPHYGTPANPFDRSTRRIPGGSSSGAAVSVADRMAYAGLGSDTGGSCRIPAALCGITGFKPTQRRISREGVEPLSSSYDTVGAMAATVGCCALLDAVMAGEPSPGLDERREDHLRLLLPTNVVVEDLDEATGAAFDHALRTLSASGVAVEGLRFEPLVSMPDMVVNGGIQGAEAYAHHRPIIQAHRDEYDPRVLARIELAAAQNAADYVDLCALRRALGAEADRVTADFDAVVLPTTPVTAPPESSLADYEEYLRMNRLMLRNTSVANILDRPAISLPCHEPGTAPVGLMLIGHAGRDRDLFAVANAVERVLARG